MESAIRNTAIKVSNMKAFLELSKYMYFSYSSQSKTCQNETS